MRLLWRLAVLVPHQNSCRRRPRRPRRRIGRHPMNAIGPDLYSIRSFGFFFSISNNGSLFY